MKNCDEYGNEIKDTGKTCPTCGAEPETARPTCGAEPERARPTCGAEPETARPTSGAEPGTELPPEFTEDKARDTANRNEVVLLAGRAMRGDDSVWGEIYEKTQRYVYYMALKFLRSEQDAQDVTQEVFIQAIRSIGQLYTADSFFGWLRSIIFSKCKDLMKKKKPILLEEDEDGGSPLDDMPEISGNFIPDMALDDAETRRMILELVDALPYQQRQAVLFYYYDEMTVGQIAAVMECPEGTVKSRLNYARRQIKKGVEEHEKKGVKLYGTAVLPILSILLREQAKTMLIPQTVAGGLGSILGTAASSAAVTAEAGAAVSAATAEATAGTTGSVAGAAEAGAATAGATAEATAGTVTSATTAATTADAATTAASAATATGAALTTKIIIGIVTAAVLIGGGVMLLISGDDTSRPEPPLSPITSPPASDRDPQTEPQVSENNGNNTNSDKDPNSGRIEIPGEVRAVVEQISGAFQTGDRAELLRLWQDPALKNFLLDNISGRGQYYRFKVADVVFAMYDMSEVGSSVLEAHLTYLGLLQNGNGPYIRISGVSISDDLSWLAGIDSEDAVVGMNYHYETITNDTVTGAWEDAIYRLDGSLYYSESGQTVDYLLEGISHSIRFGLAIDDGYRYLQRNETFFEYSKGLQTGNSHYILYGKTGRIMYEDFNDNRKWRVVNYNDSGVVISDSSGEHSEDYVPYETEPRFNKTGVESLLNIIRNDLDLPNQ